MRFSGAPVPGRGTAAAGLRPPVSLTSFVGRARALEELDALARAQRLVTLTGAGGSGKTRLAAELALRLEWQRADSVAWVELAACANPEEVAQRVATALSLRSTAQVATEDALIAALCDRELLLVFDDCEHLVEACATLAHELLVHCPRLHIVVTSREPLGIAGEHVWPVPSIAPEDALRLFAERAAAVDPTFALHPENQQAVEEICRRLDGLPLAIELAAARIRMLTPGQIAARLEDCFAILTGGDRRAVARHRTLRAAIDWSFALLSPEEQQLLARLSVFAGSFSLEAAELVCEADLDRLTGLVDKSLVGTHGRRGVVRYQLLETIRQYAAERLGKSGEARDVRQRHATAFLAIAGEAVVDPMGAVMTNLDRLDAEYDNACAALQWSLAHEPDAIALPLAAALRWYWYYRIRWSEGLGWLTRVLERASVAVSPARASALAGAGTFEAYLGQTVSGRARLEEAESAWRGLGDTRELALTLSALAHLLANAGELEAASARAEESVALARASGTRYDIAYCLTNATALVAQRRGSLEEADRALAEAETIWSPTKHPLGLPFVLCARALLSIRRGDPAVALSLAKDALEETRANGDYWFSARALRVIAYSGACEATVAARLLGAAETLLSRIGARMLLHERELHDALLARLQDELSGDELEAALSEGRSLPFEAVFDLASAVNPRTTSVDVTAQLEVRDLGPLRLTLGGVPLPCEKRSLQREREMLAFLLAHPHGCTREEVGVAFWPEATGAQVKNAFHVTLHRLRKLLGGTETIVADGARYQVSVPRTVASMRFEEEAGALLRAERPDAQRLEAVLALYEGDYLQGEEAGEWCLPIRGHLRQLHLRGLFLLGQLHESRGRYKDAVETFTRVLARDPFHEPAARQLMICHARLGSRSESLLVYRQLEDRLRVDLEAAPEADTISLYQRVRQNESV
jgi:predicted ATPase/DNA-binding SARP family transcriptional activator